MEPIVFSIEERRYPSIKKEAQGKLMKELTAADLEFVPFGEDYKDNFVLRSFNLGDRVKIEAIVAQNLAKAGFNDRGLASDAIRDQEYGFAVVEVLAREKPESFNKEKLCSDLDQRAVVEVGHVFNEMTFARGRSRAKDSEKTPLRLARSLVDNET